MAAKGAVSSAAHKTAFEASEPGHDGTIERVEAREHYLEHGEEFLLLEWC